MNITTIGRGNIGGGLARLWEKAGHTVTALGSEGGDASSADVVLVAVPGGAISDALGKVGGLDGKVVIDASVYHISWSDVQTLFALPICQQYVALNLGNAKIDGFDLAVSVRPTKGLTLGASVSRINARYTTSIPGAGGTTIRQAGEPFNVAPWSVELNGEYSRPVGGTEMYLRADLSYNSHNGKPVNVNSPLVDPLIPRPPATTLLNLRLGARFALAQANGVDLSFFVNNVTGSQPLLSLYHDTLDSNWYRSGTFRPRTFGLTATVRR